METEYNDGAHMEIPIHHQIGNRSKPTSLYSLLSMFTFIPLLIIIILIILVSLAVVVALFFLPRPKKPVFVVEAIHLRSIDLNISSIKHQLIYLPPFTVSMSFATTNPNNFAITYSSTELHVFYSDSPVGVIRVPTFYQPPHRDHGNTNISFSIHATIYRQQRFNLTQLVVDIGNQNSSTEFRVVGCVPLGVSKIDNFLPLPLPVIKIAVDCKIWMGHDHGLLMLASVYQRMASIKKHKATLPLSNLPHVSHKCSFSLCF